MACYNVSELVRGNTYAVLFIYPCIFIFYTLPVILRFFGFEGDYNIFFRTYAALQNSEAMIIYELFICTLMIFIWLGYRKKKHENVEEQMLPMDMLENESCSIYENGLLFLSLLSVLWLLTHPAYWSSIFAGYGARFKDAGVLEFPSLVLSLSQFASILLFLCTKSKRKIVLVIILMLLNCYIYGKRSYVFTMVVFLAYAALLSKKATPRTIIRVLIAFIPLLIAYAVIYAGSVRSTDIGLNTYVSVELSRDYTTIYAICAELTGIKILNYRLETVLYSLLFWLPRAWAPWKPYPFAQYMTVELLGASRSLIGVFGWGTTTSISSEFVANFGLIGLAICILFVMICNRKADKAKTIRGKFLTIYFCFYSLTVEFAAIAVAFTIIVLYSTLFEKIQMHHNRKLARREGITY